MDVETCVPSSAAGIMQANSHSGTPLTEAVTLLDRSRINTMIYNHQLCLIPRSLWPWTVRSISDWKNEYHPECTDCSVKDHCGGFFFSAKYKVSEHIHAIHGKEQQQELAVLDI